MARAAADCNVTWGVDYIWRSTGAAGIVAAHVKFSGAFGGGFLQGENLGWLTRVVGGCRW